MDNVPKREVKKLSRNLYCSYLNHIIAWSNQNTDEEEKKKKVKIDDFNAF